MLLAAITWWSRPPACGRSLPVFRRPIRSGDGAARGTLLARDVATAWPGKPAELRPTSSLFEQSRNSDFENNTCYFSHIHQASECSRGRIFFKLERRHVLVFDTCRCGIRQRELGSFSKVGNPTSILNNETGQTVGPFPCPDFRPDVVEDRLPTSATTDKQ